MIRSMTGFGKGVEKSPYGDITAEVKSLNHKHLSIACSPLEGIFLLEEKIKKVCEKKLFRGKVFVKITREAGGGGKPLQAIAVNESIAGEYLKKIKKMQKSLGVGGKVEIQRLIELPGVIESSADKKETRLWSYIRKALEKALENLVEYRESEGSRLAEDFNAALSRISGRVSQIKKNDKKCVEKYRRKLVRTIRDVAENIEPDKSKLETEVALFARNCDIAEEIMRLEGHMAAYKDAMKGAKRDVGKKLDFIAQEMQREVNTIGAKSSDIGISKAVIEVKTDIEKMREQIRNVE